MENIKGAIFDMDGTLIDSLCVWDVIWDSLGEEYGKKGFRPSSEDDKAVRTMILADCCDFIHEKYHLGKDGKELLDRMNRIAADFYANTVQMKDCANELLEHLAAKGVKMCVATATAMELVNVAVERCGLRKYFVDILSCDSIGKGKDQPDIFLLALEKLGTEKGATWVFEDSALAVDTAKKAGFHTVGIYDRYNYGQDFLRENADIYISEHETFKKLV